MTRRDLKDATWFSAFILLMVLAVQSARCAASTREKVLNATLVSVDAARSSFVAYELVHQKAIVAESPDAITASNKLGEWRKEQSKVESLFAGVYRGIAAAAVLNDDASLAGLLKAAGLLQDELKDLGVL